MKYIRMYEELGDSKYRYFSEGIKEFIDNNVGELISYCDATLYLVEYKNVPEKIVGMTYQAETNFYYNVVLLDREEIIFYSSNREECELFLVSNKYNI